MSQPARHATQDPEDVSDAAVHPAHDAAAPARGSSALENPKGPGSAAVVPGDNAEVIATDPQHGQRVPPEAHDASRRTGKE